jgi:hypothetical protein
MAENSYSLGEYQIESIVERHILLANQRNLVFLENTFSSKVAQPSSKDSQSDEQGSWFDPEVLRALMWPLVIGTVCVY